MKNNDSLLLSKKRDVYTFICLVHLNTHMTETGKQHKVQLRKTDINPAFV